MSAQLLLGHYHTVHNYVDAVLTVVEILHEGIEVCQCNFGEGLTILGIIETESAVSANLVQPVAVLLGAEVGLCESRC